MDRRIVYVLGILTGIMATFAFLYRKLERLNELEEHRKKVDDYNKERIRKLNDYLETIPTDEKIDLEMRRAERRYNDDSEE